MALPDTPLPLWPDTPQSASSSNHRFRLFPIGLCLLIALAPTCKNQPPPSPIRSIEVRIDPTHPKPEQLKRRFHNALQACIQQSRRLSDAPDHPRARILKINLGPIIQDASETILWPIRFDLGDSNTPLPWTSSIPIGPLDGQPDIDRAISEMCSALGQIPTLPQLPEHTLRKHLQPESELLEPALEITLTHLSPTISKRLIDLVQDERTPLALRLRAVGILAEKKEVSAVSALIDLTRHQSSAFVSHVIFALAQIGGTQAEAFLITLASGHPQPWIQQVAKDALSELRASPSHASP